MVEPGFQAQIPLIHDWRLTIYGKRVEDGLGGAEVELGHLEGNIAELGDPMVAVAVPPGIHYTVGPQEEFVDIVVEIAVADTGIVPLASWTWVQAQCRLLAL
jgi:hypothetical protein